MKEWFLKFWDRHGERTVFMFGATLFAVCFIVYDADGEIGAAGRTILIGVAMLAYNKSRGSEQNKIEDVKPNLEPPEVEPKE